MTVAIRAIGKSIPNRLVRVTDLPEFAQLSELERATLLGLGITTIACADGQTSSDLAIAAGIEALMSVGLEPSDLDALIVIPGRIPAFFVASESTHIQDAIGARRAITFSVGDLGCVSISSALLVGSALLKVNSHWEHVLIVHGCTPSGPHRFRYPVTVNGDGGIAVVLSRSGTIQILDILLETNGTYWDLYRLAYFDKPFRDWREECRSVKLYSFQLAIESRNRFKQMNERMLRRHSLSYLSVQHFVMQNLSIGAFHFYEESLGIQFADACRTNVARFGHLGPADIILNIDTGLSKGHFLPGDRVLLMNNSPVAAWSSMLLEV